MKERLRKLRKTLDLTQQKFADKVGVKQNTIAQYEMGRNDPSDSVITLICKEFSVNEEWLRSGNGDMFTENSKDKQMADFLSDVHFSGDNSFKYKLIQALSKLNEDEWELLAKIAKEISNE